MKIVHQEQFSHFGFNVSEIFSAWRIHSDYPSNEYVSTTNVQVTHVRIEAKNKIRAYDLLLDSVAMIHSFRGKRGSFEHMRTNYWTFNGMISIKEQQKATRVHFKASTRFRSKKKIRYINSMKCPFNDKKSMESNSWCGLQLSIYYRLAFKVANNIRLVYVPLRSHVFRL